MYSRYKLRESLNKLGLVFLDNMIWGYSGPNKHFLLVPHHNRFIEERRLKIIKIFEYHLKYFHITGIRGLNRYSLYKLKNDENNLYIKIEMLKDMIYFNT